MRTILLSMIAVSTFLSANFSRNSNGIVEDSKTGLFWQDDYADNADTIKNTTWSEAINYCEASSLGGYDDWRLPNQKELLSIVDYGVFNPAISSVFQKNASDYYWSSTTYASDTNYALDIYFDDGYTNSDDKSYNSYVRCVRAGQ